eukprot:CAMPEP_0202441340 /NCGR_PEP_ID=MMETSP1360-20130828/821_1 /ASSEMBLY_ACC=CAM_ASM_000848 /TAXON_ID=515479 /ORGANISM="Licmophora paradoxa, Strain CCMP2313" /LENGTH=175 /DNA_ID=CAMNT_0049056275 /DNA_START=88 /DNA_END=615 /DNA_ORIENTATION=+
MASLASQYPVNSLVELTLSNDEKVQGCVYCTDEISNTVVLKKSLPHTTLASEVFMVHAPSINSFKIIQTVASDEEKIPLGNVNRKTLEQQEKRALRLAEDAMKHINQKASAEGQVVFDRLLKACNEVEWKGESILVLNQIQVDPPYGVDNCRLLKSDRLGENSLDRVKKIVGHST